MCIYIYIYMICTCIYMNIICLCIYNLDTDLQSSAKYLAQSREMQ